MNLDFSTEQLALRDMARDLFEKVNPPSRVRAVFEGAEPDADAWRTIVETGIADLLVPEGQGGQGGDEVDLVLVLEEAGRAALPDPLIERALGDPVSFNRGAMAAAAFLNGVSLRLVEMTLDHVASRHQFGKPIGSFQAIKHRLAEMHVALESARPAAWYAAYAIAHGLPDASEAASVAKIAANEAHALINREALQCHGGIGFTWEHDLHLWLKRGLAVMQSYGTAREHRARLAQIMFEGESHA